MISRFELFCGAINSISRCIMKIERVEMAKLGLKGPHATCLLAMARYPEGITAVQLCDICEKDKAAISRTIGELEQAEMLTRTDPDGKRYRSVLQLTEKGSQAAQKVYDLVYHAVRQIGDGYSAEERQIFVNVLGMIAENLQDLCQNGLEVTEEA